MRAAAPHPRYLLKQRRITRSAGWRLPQRQTNSVNSRIAPHPRRYSVAQNPSSLNAVMSQDRLAEVHRHGGASTRIVLFTDPQRVNVHVAGSMYRACSLLRKASWDGKTLGSPVFRFPRGFSDEARRQAASPVGEGRCSSFSNRTCSRGSATSGSPLWAAESHARKTG